MLLLLQLCCMSLYCALKQIYLLYVIFCSNINVTHLNFKVVSLLEVFSYYFKTLTTFRSKPYGYLVGFEQERTCVCLDQRATFTSTVKSLYVNAFNVIFHFPRQTYSINKSILRHLKICRGPYS